MKLSKIKLAGFKSFVDPTVFDLRSNLVAIVGPNGCGKSNIIDAVRWVMGESSAKNLRGESMTDVIFNGSNSRKPVGQASIELYFDNSDGKLGGEYASYAEICIRREVNRDSQSSYFLNGTRCRRRDIQDVFMGTGLGPRSYSIIEQGMISRVIESKPEDLRNFLEEAAGISVYKKRRHETELRMKHTRENMTRLEDLRDEQIKLVEKLKKQSEAARNFNIYNDEKQTLDAQLLAMRWNQYDKELHQISERVREHTVRIEAKQAERSKVDTLIEKFKQDHQAKQDIFNSVQSRFFELGSEIARNEQTISHFRDKKQQLESDLDETKLEVTNICEQKDIDNSEMLKIAEKLKDIKPLYSEAEQKSKESDELYQDALLSQQTLNEEWEQFQSSAQQKQHDAEVQRSRIEQLDKSTHDLQNRISKLRTEDANFDLCAIENQVNLTTQAVNSFDQQANSYKEEISLLQDKIGMNRKSLHENRDSLDKVREKLQQLKGREASLVALQQAALGKDDGTLQTWLDSNSLSLNKRFGELLTVESGWELAVETVLSDYLEAVCIDDGFEDIAAKVDTLSDGKLIIYNSATNENESNSSDSKNLLSKITSELPINELLHKVLVAETLAEAISQRSDLGDGQTIITKDGVWLGKSWLRVAKQKDQHKGIVQREQELRKLQAEIESLTSDAEQLSDSVSSLMENLQELEQKLLNVQHEKNKIAEQLRDSSSKLSASKTRLENVTSRKARIAEEISEHEVQLKINSEESNKSRTILSSAIDAMANIEDEREELIAKRQAMTDRVKNLKIQAKEDSEERHELQLELKTATTKYEGLQHTLTRVEKQLSDLYARQKKIQDALQEDIVPSAEAKEQLEGLLQQRIEVEKQLDQAREQLEEIDAKIREHDKQRNDIEKQTNEIRETLDKHRLEWQSLEVRKETLSEQMAEKKINVEQVMTSMPEDANESEWSERSDKLGRKISSLGAINLAAIEEYGAEEERYKYMEEQYADLTEALITLENAIKKIDRETRATFKETFNKVNDSFTELFPKLFRGGKASLDLLGEDLLDAGVSVMAQPPGKKNASIHLLSGGEKALTAVALVFAIFQLNPAPFCMLDEVDAPLDDSNVGRFSDLIVEMSDKVQFIMITHNKISMESANQLVGVTMKEPGVSRLVSVDVNEAVEMTAA